MPGRQVRAFPPQQQAFDGMHTWLKLRNLNRFSLEAMLQRTKCTFQRLVGPGPAKLSKGQTPGFLWPETNIGHSFGWMVVFPSDLDF